MTTCFLCGGTGKSACTTCGGRGKTGGLFGIGAKACPFCRGTGDTPCPSCHGGHTAPSVAPPPASRAAPSSPPPVATSSTLSHQLPEGTVYVFRKHDPSLFHRFLVSIVGRASGPGVEVAHLAGPAQRLVVVFGPENGLAPYKRVLGDEIAKLASGAAVNVADLAPDVVVTNVAGPGETVDSDAPYQSWRERIARGEFAVLSEVKTVARHAPLPARDERAASVHFVREEKRNVLGRDMVYRIHKGPDEGSALAFLQHEQVTVPLHYLVVETPEGRWCRDTQGVYKEG